MGKFKLMILKEEIITTIYIMMGLTAAIKKGKEQNIQEFIDFQREK